MATDENIMNEVILFGKNGCRLFICMHSSHVYALIDLFYRGIRKRSLLLKQGISSVFIQKKTA